MDRPREEWKPFEGLLSIFDLVELLLERSGLGYSCFLNKDPSYVLNQKYSRILESDWLSSAGRFEH